MGKNLKLGAAAGTLAACAALAAPQAVAVSTYETHLGLSDNPPAFHGDLDSESSTCVAGRHIRLYRKGNNHDKVLGNDSTDATGAWAITEPDEFTLKSGVYYAKATASLNMTGDRCTRDKTRKVSVD